MLKHNSPAARNRVRIFPKLVYTVQKAVLLLAALLVLIGSPLFQQSVLSDESATVTSQSSSWWYRASGGRLGFLSYVLRSGDVDVQYNGVLLSSTRHPWWEWTDCPGDEGKIKIRLDYPIKYRFVNTGYYVSRITVEFYDNSYYAAWWVKGPKLKVQETGQQFFLNKYRRKGYHKTTVRIASHPLSGHSTIEISACGFDEVKIKKVRLTFNRWSAIAGGADITITFGRRSSYRFRYGTTGPFSQDTANATLKIRSQGNRLMAYTPNPLVKSLTAEVFSLNGQKLLEACSNGNRLAITQDVQKTLANGVYLVVVTMKYIDGSIHREVRKIVVMR